MNKEQFLLQLGEKLASLPYSEVRRSLDFYKEIIDRPDRRWYDGRRGRDQSGKY